MKNLFSFMPFNRARIDSMSNTTIRKERSVIDFDSPLGELTLSNDSSTSVQTVGSNTSGRRYPIIYPNAGQTILPISQRVLLPCKETLPSKLAPLKDECFVVSAAGPGFDTIEARLDCGKETNSKRKVRIKRYNVQTLSNDRAKDLHREWDVVANIRHPQIAEFLESFHSYDDGRLKYLNLVFEKMDYTLEKYYDHMQKKDENGGQGVTVRTRSHNYAAALITQILRALSYLHNLGIVHRDVKPASIGVNSMNFEVKLLDFSIARHLGNKMTVMRGAPAFSAPEVLLKNKYDGKADIWSLGITFLGFFGPNPLLVEPIPRRIQELVERIVCITGTPKPVPDYLKDIKVYRGMEALTDVAPRVKLKDEKGSRTGENLFKLLQAMLKFRPEDRKSAEELLEEDYVAETNRKYDALERSHNFGDELEKLKRRIETCSYRDEPEAGATT